MACRVGITTDLERRKQEHSNVYRGLRNWREFGPFKSRAAAQDWEDSKKGEWRCDAHGGGSDPDTPGKLWHGYYFEHDGKR